MKYSYHPHAEKELERVEKHYDNILEELGNRFRDEIQIAISRILKFPKGWQPLSQAVRRHRLRSFPYGIVYRVKADEIRILAVMHLHQEPNYWEDRL
jgi:plasmid stabilization system protein ParE